MEYYITDAEGNIVPSENGGKLDVVETLTDDKTLRVEDSGKTFLLDATGEDITLPAAANGLNYKFVVIEATATTDWTINSTEANIQGYANVNYATVLASNETTVNIVATKAIVGDVVELVCDGTNWYAKAEGSVAASITFTVNP